ncbi:hypothetical protein ACFL4C_01440 [Candidatus Omnitrophota bacterium]
MRNFDERVKRIEDQVGSVDKKSYLFLLFGCLSPARIEQQERTFYQRGNFKGLVGIWEMRGKKYLRVIDSSSGEGKRILLEYGYREISFGI